MEAENIPRVQLEETQETGTESTTKDEGRIRIEPNVEGLIFDHIEDPTDGIRLEDKEHVHQISEGGWPLYLGALNSKYQIKNPKPILGS